MLSESQLFALGDDEGWQKLKSVLGNSCDSLLLKNILDASRNRGCVFAILEQPYIDRDFSASFSAFYASLFRPYKKFCKRLHLFAVDLSDLYADPDPASIPPILANANDDYLGYVVLRPLSHAPVSRAHLSHHLFAPEAEKEVSVRIEQSVHLLGATLTVEGFPLTQQDTRVGACAQASIWMAGRFFHLKHKAPWFSLPEITSNALRPTDAAITRSLPAGSDYLTTDNMVRALRAMGRHPVFYAPHHVDGENTWGFDPSDVISQYVDSGIPVILGVNDGAGIGHALTAVGTVRTEAVNFETLAGPHSQSLFCTDFLVMDDQRGAYLRLPVDGESADGIPFNLRDHLVFMIVPLPNKVFMTSEVAEMIARGIIGNIGSQIEGLKAQLPQARQGEWPPEPTFYGNVAEDKLVARTYLTYGWKYKSRAVRNNTSAALKREALKRDFPKYVWVTEFSYPEETAAIDPCRRGVRAHVVIDATGSKFWDSILIAESPGVVVAWDFSPDNSRDRAEQSLSLVDHASQYYPKIRGHQGFDACAVAQASE